MIVDNKKAMVLGFNFTSLDIKKSRSLGLITVNPKIVSALTKVIDADHNRVPPIITSPRLVVSPENARAQLTDVHQRRAPRAADLRRQPDRRRASSRC